jgi:hypothetical protein
MRISGAASALSFGRRRRFDGDRLAPVVVAAGRADVVRQLQLVAMGALDEGRRADRQVRSPLALARLRDLSLWDTHVDFLDRR